ncbi:hypothetical protein CONPUDRAFT_74110 [Coniophora puteana RWD-64-598 SS2]|uniref:Uncharacterized protein n=1 Tax=Coniophora puteana (strain RWD-64-598) TaxID=741705 RepID=A0A5M3ML66_CONPW|nr:uncharacterized protein CONPUDRAFT_74110 [Coniophora puteana RWD-64-598 SS2]EIW79757.1 hypothetical protein CONPUDRAFT_74110 [Coniophora puteana RWD-64-598 SS2]
MWAPHVLATGDLLCPFCTVQTPLKPFLCVDGEYEGRVGIKCYKPHKIPRATCHYPSGVAPPAEVLARAITNPKTTSPFPSPSSSTQALATSPSPSQSAVPLPDDTLRLSTSATLAPFPMLATPPSSMPPLPTATAPPIKKSRRARASDFVPKLSSKVLCTHPAGCSSRQPTAAYTCERNMCAKHCGAEGGCNTARHPDCRKHISLGPALVSNDLINPTLLTVDSSQHVASDKGKQKAVNPDIVLLTSSTAPPPPSAIASSSAVPNSNPLTPLPGTRHTRHLKAAWNGQYAVDKDAMARNISGEHERKARIKDDGKTLRVFIYKTALPLRAGFLDNDTCVDKWDRELRAWASWDVNTSYPVRDRDTLVFKLADIEHVDCPRLHEFTSSQVQRPAHLLNDQSVVLMRKCAPPSPSLSGSSSSPPPFSPDPPFKCDRPESKRRRINHDPPSPSSTATATPSKRPLLLAKARSLAGFPRPMLPISLKTVVPPPSPLPPSPIRPALAAVDPDGPLLWPRDWHACDVIEGLLMMRNPSLSHMGVAKAFEHVFGEDYHKSTAYDACKRWERFGGLDPHPRDVLYTARNTDEGKWTEVSGEVKLRKRGKKTTSSRLAEAIDRALASAPYASGSLIPDPSDPPVVIKTEPVEIQLTWDVDYPLSQLSPLFPPAEDMDMDSSHFS